VTFVALNQQYAVPQMCYTPSVEYLLLYINDIIFDDALCVQFIVHKNSKTRWVLVAFGEYLPLPWSLEKLIDTFRHVEFLAIL